MTRADAEAGQQLEVDHILDSVQFSRSLADIERVKTDTPVQQFRDAPDSQVEVLCGRAVPYELRVPRHLARRHRAEQHG